MRRNDALVAAYERFHRELSNVLYECDPASMGSSIAAPRDEYDMEAARLAAALNSVKDEREICALLLKSFGVCNQPLLEGVEKALRRFKLDTETAKRT